MLGAASALILVALWAASAAALAGGLAPGWTRRREALALAGMLAVPAFLLLAPVGSLTAEAIRGAATDLAEGVRWLAARDRDDALAVLHAAGRLGRFLLIVGLAVALLVAYAWLAAWFLRGVVGALDLLFRWLRIPVRLPDVPVPRWRNPFAARDDRDGPMVPAAAPALPTVHGGTRVRLTTRPLDLRRVPLAPPAPGRWLPLVTDGRLVPPPPRPTSSSRPTRPQGPPAP